MRGGRLSQRRLPITTSRPQRSRGLRCRINCSVALGPAGREAQQRQSLRRAPASDQVAASRRLACRRQARWSRTDLSVLPQRKPNLVVDPGASSPFDVVRSPTAHAPNIHHLHAHQPAVRSAQRYHGSLATAHTARSPVRQRSI